MRLNDIPLKVPARTANVSVVVSALAWARLVAVVTKVRSPVPAVL